MHLNLFYESDHMEAAIKASLAVGPHEMYPIPPLPYGGDKAWYDGGEIRKKVKWMMENVFKTHPNHEIFMTIHAMEEPFVTDLASSPEFMWKHGYEPTYCTQVMEFVDVNSLQIRIPLAPLRTNLEPCKDLKGWQMSMENSLGKKKIGEKMVERLVIE